MMANLFSIFDPASALNMNLNWMSIFVGLLFLPPSLFLFSSRPAILWKNGFNLLFNETSGPLLAKSKHFLIIFLALFSLIMFNNSLGLLPHVFTASSHLAFSLPLALPLWAAYYSFGWVNKFKSMMAHLVPNGTPSQLIPFMVIVETVSGLIRPLTLAVRLAANMIAGHLLMALLSNYAHILNPSIMLVVVMSQVLLVILETAVAVIQAYVFAVLSVLYISEI